MEKMTALPITWRKTTVWAKLWCDTVHEWQWQFQWKKPYKPKLQIYSKPHLIKLSPPFAEVMVPQHFFFSFTSKRHVIQWIFDNSEKHIHFLQSSQNPLGKLVPMLILHTFEHNVWINIWENLSPHTYFFFSWSE